MKNTSLFFLFILKGRKINKKCVLRQGRPVSYPSPTKVLKRVCCTNEAKGGVNMFDPKSFRDFSKVAVSLIFTRYNFAHVRRGFSQYLADF